MATTTDLPETSFAYLHERLGGVPLVRIRRTPAPGTATEEDLLRAQKPTCELIDGVLVEKAMGTLESMLGSFINGQVWNHAQENDLGVTLGADGFIRLGVNHVRAPDVTYIPWSEFPSGQVPEDEAFWAVSPGLIVEVLSPGNTKAEIDRKLAELFGIGCRLAWVIDPRAKSAKVYTSAKKFRKLDETDTLDGGKVLPGFKLALADLFASTKRRKKKPR
jgi:Uma2 family endonuclease